MNILFLDWPCFCRADVLNFFSRRGDQVVLFSHPDYDKRRSDSFLSAADRILEEHHFDFCFSYNFFPLMARACHTHRLCYISFVYDSPQVKLFSCTVLYPTNYIFLFDSALAGRFRREGISTFYYMPLPVDSEKIQRLLQRPYDRKRLSAEVSFVGSLYNEAHNLYDTLTDLPDYTRGYLDALLEAQLHIQGNDLLEESLTPELLTQLQEAIQYRNNPDGAEDFSYMFLNYYLCRKLTTMERTAVLTAVARRFPLKIFTQNEQTALGSAQNMGSADYVRETPYIFHDSRINLNITLRSIKSGIPLRCMEILASGGFLLTNLQPDLLRHFTPMKDFVYYETPKDLLQKIDHYLCHEDQRAAIAQSGYERVRQFHSYEAVFKQIFSLLR